MQFEDSFWWQLKNNLLHLYLVFHKAFFNSVQQLEPTNTTQFQSPGLPATTELGAPDNHVQPAPLVGPRPMKKYTGNGQAPLNKNLTGLVSKRRISLCTMYVISFHLIDWNMLTWNMLFTLFVLQAYFVLKGCTMFVRCNSHSRVFIMGIHRSVTIMSYIQLN